MPGITALRKVQIGQEATAGSTSTAASTIWRGMGVLDDMRELTFAEENIGILGDTLRTYTAKTGGEIELTGDATFEQLGYFFQSGIYSATPTTDASSGFIWTWSVQNASSDPIETTDLVTLAIQAGDNQQAELMFYGFTRELNISGNAGESLQVSGTIEGRGVETGSFTGSLSIPTVEEILFSKGYLYIDPSSDTPGTTLKSNTLLSMDLNFTTGWQSVFAARGETDFAFIKRAKDELTCDITFEHDATAVAEIAAWRAETEKVLRLKFVGATLGTTDAGATYDAKQLIIDLYGKWENFEPLDEQDGNDVYTGTFRAGYASVAAKKADIIIVNEIGTLP